MYLVGMVGALWYDLPALAGHEVEELVDEEGGGEGLDPAPRYRDQLPADRTPEKHHYVQPFITAQTSSNYVQPLR